MCTCDESKGSNGQVYFWNKIKNNLCQKCPDLIKGCERCEV